MRLSILGFALSIALGGVAMADSLTVSVIPSIAPNVFGSPNWDQYMDNGLYALQNGLSNYGGNPANDPAAYQAAGQYVPTGAFLVTTFNSWLGVANPAAPFNQEYGNRVHFGAHIVDTASTFDLAEVSFAIDSNDPADALSYHDDLSGTDFGTKRIGIYYGADGIKGTSDDVIYDSANPGSDTVKINELFYIGAANSDVPPTVADLPAYLDYYNDVTLSATYTVTDDDGITASGSAAVTGVAPLPASAFAGLPILAGLALVRLTRSRKAAAI